MPVSRSVPPQPEVYLDFNATTPTDRRVVEAMLPFFTSEFGNPASGQHSFGRRAKAAVDDARTQVASLVGANSSDLIFTGSSTEASNLFLKGLCARSDGTRPRVLMSATEHKAVLEVGSWLALQGFAIDILPVDSDGVMDIGGLRSALAKGGVLLVSVIAANNETGSLNPIAELAELAHVHGALFHTDATQLAGKLPLDVIGAGVDAASFSAHKLYGPKGVGALYLKRGLKKRVAPLLHGGGQESGLRSGTVNVPAIVGFGEAADLARQSLLGESIALRKLRDHLHAGLTEGIGNVTLNGHATERLPNTLNLRLIGAEAEAVMINMPGIAVSTGSACTSELPTTSHVLRAMGLSDIGASESIRFSLGRPTTLREVQIVVEAVCTAVGRVRTLNALEAS